MVKHSLETQKVTGSNLGWSDSR